MYHGLEKRVAPGWRYVLRFYRGGLYMSRSQGTESEPLVSLAIDRSSVTAHLPGKPDVIFFATSEVEDQRGPCWKVPVILQLEDITFIRVFRINRTGKKEEKVNQ